MKLTVNRSDLQSALSLVVMAVAARSAKPILSSVLLTAEEDRLTLRGTDLETSVQQSTSQVQIEKAGVSLISANRLLDIVKSAVDDTLTIEQEGDAVFVRSSDSEFKMWVTEPGEFPAEPKAEGDVITVPLSDLQHLLARVWCAAARTVDVKFQAMTGVLLDTSKKNLVLVATDGRRMAMSSCDMGKAAEVKAVLPLKSMAIVRKLSGDKDSIVSITVAKNRAIFECEGARIGTALIEGDFPPYLDVIPKRSEKFARLPREAFILAVERASLFCGESTNCVRFSFSSGNLQMNAVDPAAGETKVKFPCDFKADSIEIGFDPRYLIDGLKAVHDDEMILEMTAPDKPGLLKGEDFSYVIMPLNLNAEVEK